MADDYQVKDAAGAPFIKAAKDIGGGRKADLTVIPGVSFGDASVASLTAGQAAGTSIVLAANTARSALKIVPPADCYLAVAPGKTAGIPLYGGVQNTFEGNGCPTNALYLIGLSPGGAVMIWEG
jgi:hypothetical protein